MFSRIAFFCVFFLRACSGCRFGMHFSRFSTYFRPLFHEKPSIPYIILQSAKVTTWLLFRLAPASCDFASCFARFSKGDSSGFQGAKTCFYFGFSTFASQKHENPEFCEKYREIYFRPLFGLQNGPRFSAFGTFFRLLSAKIRKSPRKIPDKFRKVRFLPILLLPGSILEPPGTISEPPGLDFGASGP